MYHDTVITFRVYPVTVIHNNFNIVIKFQKKKGMVQITGKVSRKRRERARERERHNDTGRVQKENDKSSPT